MSRIIIANRRGHQIVEWDATTDTEEARQGVIEAERIIREAVWRKELKHHVGEEGFIQPARTMSAIGG